MTAYRPSGVAHAASKRNRQAMRGSSHRPSRWYVMPPLTQSTRRSPHQVSEATAFAGMLRRVAFKLGVPTCVAAGQTQYDGLRFRRSNTTGVRLGSPAFAYAQVHES